MTNTDSDNSQEWAAQAYALLKKRQEEQKQELQKQEEQKQELQKQEEQKQELQKQEEQKQELQKQEEQKQELIGSPNIENFPNLNWESLMKILLGQQWY